MAEIEGPPPGLGADDPVTLDEACLWFFRNRLKRNSLTRAADRGELTLERLGGRLFVTKAAIEEWRVRCRDKKKAHGSGSGPSENDATDQPNAPSGSSSTAEIKRARDAAEATVTELKARFGNTSTKSTSPRSRRAGRGTVVPFPLPTGAALRLRANVADARAALAAAGSAGVASCPTFPPTKRGPEEMSEDQEWNDISTAPKDGTVIRLKRVHEGRKIAEGNGVFGHRHEDAPGRLPLDPDPLDRLTPGQYRAEEEARLRELDQPRWLTADRMYLFPEPTHWAPCD